MSENDRFIEDDLNALLNALPPRIREPLALRPDKHELIEVVLDLGRAPEARFLSEDILLDAAEVNEEDLQYVTAHVGEFGGDNRAGLERTLHRISAMRNRKGKIVGLTCRVGRAVFGTIKSIEDLVMSGRNVLLLGRPGVGKTTMLREVARVLAGQGHRRVVVVDTSNEIAGDGDVPHPGIGRARRMQVPTPALQHGVMIEAVENHMPEVIIIDEMGTELEAAAARTIAERGVQLIATAHGNTLENLILNPTLSDLVGGIQTVTLGDEEAKRRRTQKTILERKAPPTFDIVVEIQSRSSVAVHEDVAKTVDAWLRGYPIPPEIRSVDDSGELHVERQAARRGPVEAPGREPGPRGATAAAPRPAPWPRPAPQPAGGEAREPAIDRFRVPPTPERAPAPAVVPSMPAHVEEAEEEELEEVGAGKALRVFLYGVGREKVQQAAYESGLELEVVNELRHADALLTTKTHYRRGSGIVQSAETNGKPVYVLRKNSVPQIRTFFHQLGRGAAPGVAHDASFEGALQATQEAAERVLRGEPSVELAPQPAYVRRLQHMLAERYKLASVSTGRDPYRHVTIYRP